MGWVYKNIGFFVIGRIRDNGRYAYSPDLFVSAI